VTGQTKKAQKTWDEISYHWLGKTSRKKAILSPSEKTSDQKTFTARIKEEKIKRQLFLLSANIKKRGTRAHGAMPGKKTAANMNSDAENRGYREKIPTSVYLLYFFKGGRKNVITKYFGIGTERKEKLRGPAEIGRGRKLRGEGNGRVISKKARSHFLARSR